MEQLSAASYFSTRLKATTCTTDKCLLRGTLNVLFDFNLRYDCTLASVFLKSFNQQT